MKLPQINPPSAKNADLDTRQLMQTMFAKQNKMIGGLLAAVIALALALAAAIPLKETKPWVIEQNKLTGEVRVPPQGAVTAFTPSQDNVMFFVRRWIKATWTIQPQLTTSSYQPLALSTLRGKNAIAQYDAMRVNDRVLIKAASDPTLVREVEIESISSVAGAERGVVANLLMRTTSRGQITEERKLLTLYFEILPPKTEVDRDLHPIGLYIVDFKLSDAR